MANDHVQVEITVDNVGITRAGFGMPMILSHNADFGTERIRFYSSITAVADDFDTDSPEYLAANGFFAQSPKPPRIAIGRAAGAVTQRYLLEAVDAEIVDDFTYELHVEGEGVTETDIEYDSGTGATKAALHSNLVTQLNAVVGNNYIAAFAALVNADDTFTADNATEIFTAAVHGLLTGDGPFQVSTDNTLPAGLVALTDYWIIKVDANTFKLATSLADALAGTNLAISTNGTGVHTISDTASTKRPSDAFTVTGDSAGEWFSIDVPLESRHRIKIKQNHAAPTGESLATSLSAIVAASGLWYQVHTLYNSVLYVTDVAAWVGANGRTYAFDVNEYDIPYTAISGTDDTGETLLALGYSATTGSYHPRPAAMFSAAWMGRWLPTDPGSATAKFKTLEGVETVELNDTQRQNIRDRRMNSYTVEFGRPITWEGYVFSTIYRYIDVRRDVDWLTDEVTKSVFGTIAGADKIPFTPAGIAQVEGSIRKSMSLAVNKEVLAEGTTAVEVPDIDDIETADKADRVLRNVKFTGTLTGAIHAVIPIQGTVTF